MTDSSSPDNRNVHKLSRRKSTTRAKKRTDNTQSSTNRVRKRDKLHESDNDSAYLALLSGQLFQDLLSTTVLDSAQLEQLLKLKSSSGPTSDSVESATKRLHQFSNRVAYLSRGKAIGTRNINSEARVALLSQALLQNVCIQGRYNRKERLLHPCGLVIREPKIVLIATEQNPSTSEGTAPPADQIKHYLCHRFEHLALTDTPSQTPEHFQLQDYLKSGALDLPVQSLLSTLDRPFELILRLHQARLDNLLRDLEELPLGSGQSLVKEGNDGNYLLQVPDQTATHALVEWILGRQDRVEVLQPPALRQYIIGRLHATANRYFSDEPIQQQTSLYTEETAEDRQQSIQPSSFISNTIARDTEVIPQRSIYTAHDTSNTLLTWMIARIFSEMTINSSLLSERQMQTIKTAFPKAMRAHFEKSSVTAFGNAARKYISVNPTPKIVDTDPFIVNTANLGALLNLNDCEQAILRAASLIENNPALSSAVDLYIPEVSEYTVHNLVALLTNNSPDSIEYYLRDDQVLRRSGLVSRYPYGVTHAQDILKLSSTVVSALFQTQSDNNGVFSQILKQSEPALLTENDLMHVSQIISHASRLITGASKQRAKGVNILMWGPPGTGKTQLARYLGQSLELATYEVPTSDGSTDALSESERLFTYQLCQSLLAHSGKALLIFDEIENIIDTPQKVKEELSKAFVNQTLEENPVPSIWISNQVHSADAAYLRRFDYAIEIKTPDLDAKRRMAKRILGPLAIDGELLDDILERQEVGPALLSKLKRVADLSGIAQSAELDSLAVSIVEGDLAALGAPRFIHRHKARNSHLPTLQYDPDMTNANTDLGRLCKNLHSNANARFCLYGPPGTGKTAWASALAQSLSMDTIIRQPADIKNKYVGESEAAVATAFELASKQNAVLIFDEVDSYLVDRQKLDRRHQTDLVNQFLISLEHHQGIVVCTTNLMHDIDPAALRRFDHKIKFDYLTEEQTNNLFVQLARVLEFDVDAQQIISGKLTLPGNLLTPGDFATVVRKAQTGHAEITLDELHSWLMAEAEFRQPGAQQSRVGFV